MDCKEITNKIEALDERDQKIRRQLLGLTEPYPQVVLEKVKLENQAFEVVKSCWPKEYEIAYREWKRYQDGETVFELDLEKDGDFAFAIKSDGSINWRPHPKGIVFQTSDISKSRWYLFEEKDPNVSFVEDFDPFRDDHPSNLHKYQIGYDYYYFGDPATGQVGVYQPEFQIGPKGLIYKEGATSKIVLNNKYIGHSSWRWAPHVRGFVELKEIDDETGRFYLDKSKQPILEVETDRLLEFKANTDGIYTFYRYGLACDVYLNNREIFTAESPAHFKPHPGGGFLILHNFGRDLWWMDDKLASAEHIVVLLPSEALRPADFEPYPGGVIVKEEKDDKIKWVFHKISRREV